MMQKPKSVSELIQHSSKTLSKLRQRLDERGRLLLQVRAVLPARLVGCVRSAGLEGGVLTVGTDNASWASRLRYVAPEIIVKFRDEYALAVDLVRVRVVRPPPPERRKSAHP